MATSAANALSSFQSGKSTATQYNAWAANPSSTIGTSSKSSSSSSSSSGGGGGSSTPPAYNTSNGYLTDYGVSIGAKAVQPGDPRGTTAPVAPVAPATVGTPQQTVIAASLQVSQQAAANGQQLTLQQAIDQASQDPTIIAKYGDALKIGIADWQNAQSVDQANLSQLSADQKTQFINEKKNLAETEAAAGRAYSGFREQAKSQLQQSESDIIESTARTAQQNLRDLTSKFESTYGSTALGSLGTPSLSYSDPLAGTTRTFGYSPYGSIVGSDVTAKKQEINQQALSNYQAANTTPKV